MKKIYTLAVAAFASVSVMAQQAIIPAELGTKFETSVPASVAAAGGDTLGLADFSNTVQITFDIGGSGYIFGSAVIDTSITQAGVTLPLTLINGAFGRGFIANDAYNVTGAMIWFALKEGVNASPADLTVALHGLEDDVALTSPSSTAGDGVGPGAELASVALPFDDIDTSSTVLAPTFAMFSSPVWVPSDFALAVDISGLYGNSVDTVALYNEAQGTSSGDGTYSWYLQEAQGLPVAGVWIASSALGLEADLAIFAIVEESGVGIEEQGFLNGVKMTTYPNPAVSSDVVRVQYGLENAAEKVEVNVYDMNGKLMFSQVEGDRAAGIHTIDIPAGTLSAGSYVYSLEANGGRMAKQLQILK